MEYTLGYGLGQRPNPFYRVFRNPKWGTIPSTYLHITTYLDYLVILGIPLVFFFHRHSSGAPFVAMR